MKLIETDRDGVEGNDILPLLPKKQSVQRLYFCTAIFNRDLETIISILKPICKKFICGEEKCPTTGNLHYQTFIALKKKMRATELGKLIPAKWIDCKGDEEANIKYCSKDNKIFKYGFPKPINIITDLYKWQLEIEKLYHTEPDDRKIYWFHETNGNIGKSAFVKYMIVKYGCLFCDGGKKSDLINLVFNADMDTCKCIIWDLPRSSKGSISYATLESVKNGMICNTKYETGVKIFNSPHIFVFANFPPDKPDELSSDRWVITELS